MRNKIARHYGGHPFERKYTCLTDLQIVVLYRQVFLDKKQETQDMVEGYIKPLSKAWSEKFNDLFKYLGDQVSLFSNPEMFKKVEELKKQKEFEKEAEEENLDDVLFETLKAVPSYYEVETESNTELGLTLDSETDDMITGWINDKEDILKNLRE